MPLGTGQTHDAEQFSSEDCRGVAVTRREIMFTRATSGDLLVKGKNFLRILESYWLVRS